MGNFTNKCSKIIHYISLPSSLTVQFYCELLALDFSPHSSNGFLPFLGPYPPLELILFPFPKGFQRGGAGYLNLSFSAQGLLGGTGDCLTDRTDVMTPHGLGNRLFYLWMQIGFTYSLCIAFPFC